MSEPTIRRKFLKSDFDANNNKWWQVEWWADTRRYVASYGRVGDVGQVDERICGEGYVLGKVAEKLKKGYVELELHVPVAQTTTPTTKTANVISLSSPQRERLVEAIFREANEHIKASISVTVDALSQRQIALGRSILNELGNADPVNYSPAEWADYKRQRVQDYYKTIPTIMDRRPDINLLVNRFDPEKQEDLLNQLEAALSTYQATQAAPTGTSQYDLLGAQLEHLAPVHPTYKLVAEQWMATRNGGQITGIYEVVIPKEREAFERETFGDHVHAMLWHGTKGQNVRHILKTGFKIPDFFSNGWMFGPGIYLADESRKSQGYASSRYGDTMMFLVEAKIGDPYVAKAANSYKEAPKPFHSVMGKAGFTGSYGSTLRMNEYILYKASQSTIKYLVTYR